MDFDTQLDAALARVSQTGIWQSNYAPPIYRCLWLSGVQVPPPHFAKFAYNALFSGAWFAISWALVMRLMFCPPQGAFNVQALALAAIFGSLFGLTMGTYYSLSARLYGLPRWGEIARN